MLDRSDHDHGSQVQVWCTMTLANDLNSLLPDDWYISNIINLNHSTWQINASDGEHVVVASGDEIEDACDLACYKIGIGDFAGRLFSLGRLRHAEAPTVESKSLLQSLGFKPKPPPEPLRRL